MWPIESFGGLDAVNLLYVEICLSVCSGKKKRYLIPTNYSGDQPGHRPRVSGGPAPILVAIGTRATVSVVPCIYVRQYVFHIQFPNLVDTGMFIG
jgi:hypothetical protein